jgi:hypothetical protein
MTFRFRDGGQSTKHDRSCRMADVHLADRYAVDGMFIRKMLLRDRREVADGCGRYRRICATNQIQPASLGRRYGRSLMHRRSCLMRCRRPSVVHRSPNRRAHRGCPDGPSAKNRCTTCSRSAASGSSAGSARLGDARGSHGPSERAASSDAGRMAWRRSVLSRLA